MLTELDIYLNPCGIFEADVLEDTTFGMYPVFYTVRDGRILASSSALSLINEMGGFEINQEQSWAAENWPDNPDSHDKRVMRLKPFQRVSLVSGRNGIRSASKVPTCELEDIQEFIALQAKYIQQWIYDIEDEFPTYKHIFLTAGKDSLLAFLARHRNDDNWIAFSGEPNHSIVKQFFADNNLKYSLIRDDGEDKEDEEFVRRKIIATDGLINPWHFRWLQELEKLKDGYGGKVFIWQGSIGDVLNGPTYWNRNINTNEEFYNHLSRPAARWQGAYHQAAKNLLGVPCLSLYHSPELWDKVFGKYNPSIVKNLDVRFMLGKVISGKEIKWPETNPGPEPYAKQKMDYEKVKGIYFQQIRGLVPSQISDTVYDRT